MIVACLDLEGVLVPEIWIAFAEKTGIEKLRLTTRDIADYDELMRGRLKILNDNNLRISDIRNVIKQIFPMEGAKDFLSWLKTENLLEIVYVFRGIPFNALPRISSLSP